MGEMAREKHANVPTQATDTADGGDIMTAGNGKAATTNDVAGPAASPLLSTEDGHLLV